MYLQSSFVDMLWFLFWQMLNQSVLAALPHDAHPMGMLVGSICALSSFHPDANPALSVHFEFNLLNGTSLKP